MTLTEETKSENKDREDFEYFNYSPELINPASPTVDQDDNISSPEQSASPWTLKRNKKLNI